MSNHRKASIETLENLHSALADALAEKIRSGEATAADMAVARQFLKDNGIDGVPTEGSPIDGLANQMPFPTNDADEPAAGE